MEQRIPSCSVACGRRKLELVGVLSLPAWLRRIIPELLRRCRALPGQQGWVAGSGTAHTRHLSPRLSHPPGDSPTTPPCPAALLLLLKAVANSFLSYRLQLAGCPASLQVGNSPPGRIYTQRWGFGVVLRRCWCIWVSLPRRRGAWAGWGGARGWLRWAGLDLWLGGIIREGELKNVLFLTTLSSPR